MPLQRFVKVRGKPGSPVANPYAIGNNPPRFAGKARDAARDGEPEHLDRYRDVEEVMLSHQILLDAIKAGELELVAKCDAHDHEEAAKKMAAKKKSDS